ncbi:hypothetical protein FXW78_29660 [Rhodococcus opacus]|nr:hypothetical protein [Rhodococcus opacus]
MRSGRSRRQGYEPTTRSENYGSSEIFTDLVAWGAEGFLNGNPVQSAVGAVLFLGLGLWDLVTGAPIVI